jgi:hypothetical protein
MVSLSNDDKQVLMWEQVFLRDTAHMQNCKKMLKQTIQTCNTVGRGVLLISSLMNSTELRVAHANGSYVE